MTTRRYGIMRPGEMVYLGVEQHCRIPDGAGGVWSAGERGVAGG